MPVHDRKGGIPGMNDFGGGFEQDPPPQPTQEQIAAFKAQITEEATEKQAAQEKNNHETRVILSRELRMRAIHVLFMNDNAVLEARMNGIGAAEHVRGGKTVLTIDVEMPIMPHHVAHPTATPPVIEIQADSIDIHLDGHAPRAGEIGYDPAHPGRIHLEFAVSNPEEIPNLTFHHTDGARFSDKPFNRAELPPLPAPAEAPEVRITVNASQGGQTPGFDPNRHPGFRGRLPEGEEGPVPVTVFAKGLIPANTRIKPFFERPVRRIPGVEGDVPPAVIQAVIPGQQIPYVPPVEGKPVVASLHIDGGPSPFSGPINLSVRADVPGQGRPMPEIPAEEKKIDPVTALNIPTTEDRPFVPGFPESKAVHVEVSVTSEERPLPVTPAYHAAPVPEIAMSLPIEGKEPVVAVSVDLPPTAPENPVNPENRVPGIAVSDPAPVTASGEVDVAVTVPTANGETVTVEGSVVVPTRPQEADPIRPDPPANGIPLEVDVAVRLPETASGAVDISIDAALPSSEEKPGHVDGLKPMEQPAAPGEIAEVRVQAPEADVDLAVDAPEGTAANPFLAPREPGEAELPEVVVTVDGVQRPDQPLSVEVDVHVDGTRPEDHILAQEELAFQAGPAARFGEPSVPEVPGEVQPAERLVVRTEAGSEAKPLEQEHRPESAYEDREDGLDSLRTERKRAKVESKDDIDPPPIAFAAPTHHVANDPLPFNANPGFYAPRQNQPESLAHEVVSMVDRFLVTADPGSYVKELHMTLNADILPGTEIHFRQVGESLTVTLLNKDGMVSDQLRAEAPELAEALRAQFGSEVELRIETGEGRETV